MSRMRAFALCLLALAAVMPIQAQEQGGKSYAVVLKGIADQAAGTKAQMLLMKIDGVSGVIVDMNGGKSIISMKSGMVLDQAAVETALKDTGITVDSFMESGAQKGNDASTEKVWVLELNGGGGWGAAGKAQKVRATLTKVPNIDSFIVDTTFTAVMTFKPEQTMTADDLSKLLKPVGSSVKSMKEVSRAKPAGSFEVTVDGVAWADTCTEIRGIFQKLEGVVAVHPHGDTSVVQVFTAKADGLSEDAAKNAVKGKDFKVKSFKKL